MRNVVATCNWMLRYTLLPTAREDSDSIGGNLSVCAHGLGGICFGEWSTWSRVYWLDYVISSWGLTFFFFRFTNPSFHHRWAESLHVFTFVLSVTVWWVGCTGMRTETGFNRFNNTHSLTGISFDWWIDNGGLKMTTPRVTKERFYGSPLTIKCQISISVKRNGRN